MPSGLLNNYSVPITITVTCSNHYRVSLPIEKITEYTVLYKYMRGFFPFLAASWKRYKLHHHTILIQNAAARIMFYVAQ